MNPVSLLPHLVYQTQCGLNRMLQLQFLSTMLRKMPLELKWETSTTGQCWLCQLNGQVDKYYKKQKSSEQSHPTVFTTITTHLFLLSGVHIISKKN